MSELGIIDMSIKQHVHRLGLFPLAIGDGRFQPSVVLSAA